MPQESFCLTMLNEPLPLGNRFKRLLIGYLRAVKILASSRVFKYSDIPKVFPENDVVGTY
jgi:hypothetical protein